MAEGLNKYVLFAASVCLCRGTSGVTGALCCCDAASDAASDARVLHTKA